MSTLAELSDAIAAVVKTAEESVVRVEARRRLPATGLVWSEDGIIVTANHVVQKDDNIKVGLADGTTVPATLVGRDPSTDLAILKIDQTGLKPFVEVDKTSLGVGNLVLALGRPGKTVQATMGILSAYGGSWRTHTGGQIDHYLQTDLVMYPGFSGGPLVNAEGQLVGFNSSSLMRGVSLAVPTSTIARIADSLMTHGHVKKGYLGVSTQQVRLPETAQEDLKQKRGLLVVSVETGSAADKGGLTLGDTIVGVEGATVQNHDDLLAQLRGDRIGKKVSLKILRGGKSKKVSVKVGERSS
ncbi:MAG: trypsin-like peptidase domain-containing protein [Chloroflexota bacterium]